MKLLNYQSKLILIFALLASPFIVQAQNQTSPEDLPKPYQFVKSYVKDNNYITPILDLKAREEKYLASKMRMSYLEWIIQLENSVGSYDEAYRYEDVLYGEFPSRKNEIKQYKKDIADVKSSPVADYKMIDAVAAIDSIAGKNQVIMINEEHRTPFHRALTTQLLAKLYAKGFRYFAAETINEEDAELNKRGYPVQKTGTYTLDPVYADTIRTALKLGYKIVPYETRDTTCKSPEDNPEFCTDKRERDQAQNLYDRILKDDSQAKIFVHVGRGHNSKAELSKEFNFMAYYFQKITGIEPFTIDQLRFSQRYDRAMEQPLFRLLTKENLLQKPSVYQSANGKFYNLGLGYDMVIFHPRLSYKNGRATFLEMNGLRKAEKINLKRLKLAARKQVFTGKEPVLIQAFFAEESADAVPVDQIIIYPNQEIPVLMLPAGNFRIKATDSAGKVTAEDYLLRVKGKK